MFTGLIDHCGQVQSITHGVTDSELWVSTQFQDLTLGESIAIDGACLTVTAIQAQAFACQLSAETLRLTTAAQYKIGTFVNLERALRLSDRLGGHFVLGHVDQTIVVADIQPHHEFIEMRFTGINEIQQNYLIPKGSLAINGVSLTINQIVGEEFSVMLIPHTLSRTNLVHLKVGDTVNIEFDFLVKTIIRNTRVYLQEKI